LSDPIWAECTVAIAIIIPVIGASWIIGKHRDDLQQKYKNEIREMQSLVYSSKIVPKIVEIIQDVNKELKTDPQKSLERILSDERYNTAINEISNYENIIGEIKTEYKELQQNLSFISRNLLIEAFFISVLFAFHMTLYNTINNKEIIMYFIILIVSMLVIELIQNYVKYRQQKEYLSKKYDQIVIQI
jgi:cytochrome bd-type quinol oxidase subunit 2